MRGLEQLDAAGVTERDGDATVVEDQELGGRARELGGREGAARVEVERDDARPSSSATSAMLRPPSVTSAITPLVRAPESGWRRTSARGAGIGAGSTAAVAIEHRVGTEATLQPPSDEATRMEVKIEEARTAAALSSGHASDNAPAGARIHGVGGAAGVAGGPRVVSPEPRPRHLATASKASARTTKGKSPSVA